MGGGKDNAERPGGGAAPAVQAQAVGIGVEAEEVPSNAARPGGRGALGFALVVDNILIKIGESITPGSS